MPYDEIDNVIASFFDPAAQLGLNSGAAGTETRHAAGTESAMNVTATPTQISLPAPKAPATPGSANYPQLTKASGVRGAILENAKQFLGAKYVWGGNAVDGTDCSGFLQQVLKMVGVTIPRVSYQQTAMGKTVGLDQLRPGDFVAWDNNPSQPGADHIALFLGNGMIQESPRTGVPNRIRKLGANEGAWGVAMNYGD